MTYEIDSDVERYSAYHEASHTVAYLEFRLPFRCVRLWYVADRPFQGGVELLEGDEERFMTRPDLRPAWLIAVMAGQVGQEMFHGSPASQGEIKRDNDVAWSIAKQMHLEAVDYEPEPSAAEIGRTIEAAGTLAKALLRNRWEAVVTVAQSLLLKEKIPLALELELLPQHLRGARWEERILVYRDVRGLVPEDVPSDTLMRLAQELTPRPCRS